MREVGQFQRVRKDYVDADHYSDLNDAIAASDGRPVVVPSTREQATPLVIPTDLRNGFRLAGFGRIAPVTYSGEGAFLKADDSATPQITSRRDYARIEDLYVIGPGSGVAGSIGLHANNLLHATCRDLIVTDFETGIKVDGLDLANGAAAYFNEFYNVAVSSCVTAWHVTGQGNSARVFGGRAALSACGVRIDYLVSNTLIVGMDIESNTGDATSDAAVVIDGHGSDLLGCRHENPSATLEVHFNQAGNSGSTAGERNRVLGYLERDVATVVLDGSVNKTNEYAGSGGSLPYRRFINGTEFSRGHLDLGDNAIVALTESIKATRSVAADAEPMVSIADTNSASGAPIGVRYRARRFGSVGVEVQKDDGAGNFFTTHRTTTNGSSGKPEIWLGASASAAVDTVLYRDAANVLKTDDKLVIGSTVGVLKLEPITLPATCAVGELCVDTADKKLKLCTAANTWVVVGGQS